MANHRFECEVAIVGGGPAGALLAKILAGRGRRVLIVHRRGPRHGVPEETMVAGAQRLLERQGLLDIVTRHCMNGTQRHAAVWGSDRIVDRAVEEHRGFKIQRQLFDSELRQLAVASGAVLWTDASPNGRWVGPTTEVLRSQTPHSVRAQLWVYATGRGTGPRQLDVTVERELTPTIALSSTVPADVFAASTDAQDVTVVEAVREGWLWWLSLANGDAHLSLVCDRDEVRQQGRDTVWRRAVSSARGPARLMPIDRRPTAGTIATPRFLSTAEPVLLIGDAASALDPLSSQGLEKSLSSAERAALTIQTILDGAESAPRMIAVHAEWERALFGAHARQTGQFYWSEERFVDTPFWQPRRVQPPNRPLPDRFRVDPRVTEDETWEPLGHHLTPKRAFLSPTGERLSVLGPVRLERILDLIDDSTTIADVVTGATADPELFALRPSQMEPLLGELFSRGFLIAAE